MSKKLTAPSGLFADIKCLIADCRQQVAVSVNAEMTMLYWTIGKRINDDVLGNERADYGKFVIKQLAEKLTAEFGSGWGAKYLCHCTRFAAVFPDSQIVYALLREPFKTHS